MPNPAGWQDISIDFNGWSQKTSITKVQISYIANGSTQAWASKFFLNNVRLTKL